MFLLECRLCGEVYELEKLEEPLACASERHAPQQLLGRVVDREARKNMLVVTRAAVLHVVLPWNERVAV